MSEQLANKIETAYKELKQTIDQIDLLSSVIEHIKETSQDILEKYITTIDPAKLTQIREQNKTALKTMIEDVQKIERNMTDFDVVSQQTKELVDTFSSRFSTFDDVFKKTKQSITELDNKLLKLIKEAEKQQRLGQNRFLQASKLFHASAEVEKYDQLLALEKENNRILKDIQSKMTFSSVKPNADNLKHDFNQRNKQPAFHKNRNNDTQKK
jgi:methyl-accepting chemotaxis protein